MATFHQLGRYRQINVGLLVCLSIWIACLAVSSPYWIFGSTVERSRRPIGVALTTGSYVIAQTGNTTTAHAYNDYNLVGAFDLDPENGEVDPESDPGPETSSGRPDLISAPVKTTCKLVWPSVGYRKSWTYAFLVVGLFVPLVAIGIFNVLLVYRMKTLNRNKKTVSEITLPWC